MNDPTLKKDPIGFDIAVGVALAAAYRGLFLLLAPRVIDSADSIQYIEVARHFAAGDFVGFYARIPLLYPALCAFLSFFVNDFEWAGIAVSLVASSLLVVPVYLIARDMQGRRMARVATLIVVIWPWLVDYGCRVAPEALASLFWFSGIYFLVLALRRGHIWTILAPVTFFALHLTRPEGTILMLAAPLIALILLDRRDDEIRPWRLAPVALISMFLLAVYAMYMMEVTGEPTLNSRMPDTQTAVLHTLFRQGEAFIRTFIKLFGEVLPTMLGPYLLLFAGVGLFVPSYLRRDLRLELVLVSFAILQFAAAVYSTFPEPRYIMPVTIAAILWSSRGLLLVADQAHRLKQWRALRAAPVGLLVLMMLLGLAVNVVPHYLGRMSYQPVEYKIAGRWMKENLEPGLIMSRKPQVGFYADMPTTGPEPTDTIDQILKRAKEAGAKYLVVDERYSTGMIPALKPLLVPENAPSALKLLKDNLSPYRQARIVIYAFKDADTGRGGRL
ncbi:MAG: glycosyltransferase family 39 protein [Candidatus Hydrogenedentes bacterium]|nr:glycosyltransferase family 39 protein [Candidatus Hydrogenedentota bacterium]